MIGHNGERSAWVCQADPVTTVGRCRNWDLQGTTEMLANVMGRMIAAGPGVLTAVDLVVLKEC